MNKNISHPIGIRFGAAAMLVFVGCSLDIGIARPWASTSPDAGTNGGGSMAEGGGGAVGIGGSSMAEGGGGAVGIGGSSMAEGSGGAVGIGGSSVAGCVDGAAGAVKETISIGAEETVMIGTTGLPGSAFKGDTSLRLCNFLDKQVAYNDDAACNLNTGSLISFTSPYGVSQDFVLWVGCIDTPCGPNAVRIARRDPVVFSYAFQDANSTAEQTYTLEASQYIRVSTCGYAADGAEAIGDTVLRLYRDVEGTWVYVAGNDNTSACQGQCELASMIQYVVPASGKYQVRAGCATDEACSGTVVLYRQ
ncbi:hypothetical protein [Polyangium fumosum]|uniref:Uncharacterized protein n=1 Tax=Polyangium fumosum TaxID=889272 RepID=A0A4U1IYT5_9BACT|nr:hypothetical protein [Polyangium fumosum]TKC99792.1 hypothetical protein E8A74_36740 [Polyangium fumosum]